MKIFIYGVGQFFQNRKEQFREISSDDFVLGFLDNRANLVKECEGVSVFFPDAALKCFFDRIVLMSTKCPEITDQLEHLGIPREKILFWEEYRAQKRRGNLFLQLNTMKRNKGSVLIISTDLGYNGGSIAAWYAAIALEKRGYSAWLAAPSCDKKLYQEIKKSKINLLIYPSLPYVTSLEKICIEKFDFIIVNVFQMIKVASDVSQYKPVLWWIHESDDKWDSFYGYVRTQFPTYDNISSMNRLNIYAVSDVAKRDFERYYPYQIHGILPYGIPDESYENKLLDERHSKFVFATIGAVCQRKGQDIFLKAIKKLSKEIIESCEFWIIGFCGKDPYGNEIREVAQSIPQVKFLGVMSRENLKEAFSKINCVVCSSLVETMSLTITEGMMHGKICITTEHTGMAEYINHGVNGFICKVGEVDSLHDCMKKAFDMHDYTPEFRKKAKQLYEKEFSMDHFGERLVHALNNTKKRYLESS